MDEGSGTTISTSQEQQYGHAHQRPHLDTGKYGGALLFDGVNDRVRVNDFELPRSHDRRHLRSMVYPTVAPAGGETIMQKEVDAYIFSASGGGSGNKPVSGGTFNGACCARWPGTPHFPVNVWTHLAATYDGSQLRLYVNGALAASTAVTVPTR